MKRLTFLFSTTMIMLLVSSSAWATTVVIKARGTTGIERMRLIVNNTTITTWTLTTSEASYTAYPRASGECRVAYINDVNDTTAIEVNYISVDGLIRQSEDQVVNTGVWQNGQCGGSFSEMIDCNGYISYGCVGNCNNLSVSPIWLDLTAEANSLGVFDVNSEVNWTVSSDQTWLTTDPTSGSNDGSVLVIAQANSDLSPRTAILTISGLGAVSKTVTVTQDAVLAVHPSWLIIEAPANNYHTFNVSSSTSWTVSSDQSWLTIDPNSGSNNGTVTVTAQQNTGPSTRTATVTAYAPGPGVSKPVTIIQNDSSGGCIVPPVPPFSDLRDNPKFPDPFIFMDGTRMTSKSQWKCRRGEIAALIQEFELGYKQYTPYSATTGSKIGNSIRVDVNDNGHAISFSCSISYPTTGSAPYPAMIGCGFSSLDNTALRNLGVAIITFPTDQIAQQIDGSSRGIGLFYDMYGSSHSAGALMAWAWGMDRLIDAIEKTPDANIDPTRLGVTGCSRWGKGALVCGAFNERIKLTIPQESGSGGAASWRVSDWQKAQGTNVQTLSQITGENVWFRANFNQFGSAANKLPFDHHMLAALCAPDALLFIENTWQEWLGNISTWTNGNVTQIIYESLGIPDRMGFSQLGHSDHCGFPASQQPEVTAYVQKFLVGGGTADTNVMITDGTFAFDRAKWVDWTEPNLHLTGDFVSPDRVDFIDFAILGNAWLSNPAQTNWDGRCDMAKPTDNVIDILDLAVFARNWLEVDILDPRHQ